MWNKLQWIMQQTEQDAMRMPLSDEKRATQGTGPEQEGVGRRADGQRNGS